MKTNKKYDDLKSIMEKLSLNKNVTRDSIHGAGELITSCLGFLLLSFLIYTGFNYKPDVKIVENSVEKIRQEKVLRNILLTKDQNAVYTTSVDMYQAELNEIKNQVEKLKLEKSELTNKLDSQKELLRYQMLLKKEIKETELSQANGEGYSQGYDEGRKQGLYENAGSGFGGGLIMGRLMFGK